MTPADTLRALIADIEQGPPTRGLSDRVLLACTAWEKRRSQIRPGNDEWIDPDGKFVCMNYPPEKRQGLIPDPLTDLQDGTLAVPEGYAHAVYADAKSAAATVAPPSLLDKRGFIWDVEINIPEPAQALTLTGLKARLAQMEQTDDG